MHKNTGLCIYVTENNILWLYFHSSLHCRLDLLLSSKETKELRRYVYVNKNN